MTLLSGKVLLLTGGSRGLGPVIAEAVAKRGATVVLAARDENRLRDVAARLEQLGARTLIVPVDLRQAAQREELAATAVRELGAVDVLVNNAGLETEGAYAELPWRSIQENIEVNLVAPLALTHLILPEMLRRHAGHVVNIASVAAKSGSPYASVYSATKAGLAEWTRALRLELAGSGVRFSTIFPCYVRDVGMFARFGVEPPPLVGSCSPTRVAEAVADAIEKDRPETIVNDRPLRFSFALNELSPALGDWLMRFSHAVDFQRRKVERGAVPPGHRSDAR
jgi:short-subunit dehydrogenase